ncbi:MAG: hypothetical protein JNK27_05735 [Chitinophagaceae bacterium]|nr:hypothetical protein [Chitinophagaceae bacterium]
MKSKQLEDKRIIHYHDIYSVKNWFLKLYSVSSNKAKEDFEFIENQKSEISKWIDAIPEKSQLPHKIAVLIFHYWASGIYSWLVWWDKNNMPQLEVYFSEKKSPYVTFIASPDKSMIDYINEFAIVYFETREWEKYITEKDTQADLDEFLTTHFNT